LRRKLGKPTILGKRRNTSGSGQNSDGSATGRQTGWPDTSPDLRASPPAGILPGNKVKRKPTPWSKLPSVILASASPRRMDLLRRLGLGFSVVPAHVDETTPEGLTVCELCLLNAWRKGQAVAKRHPDALVLGADTLVYLGNKLFGKPASLAEAERMLLELQGQTHQVATGVCLVHRRAHRQRLFCDLSEVTLRRLTLAQIRAYFSLVNPLDKAGAYAIQEHGRKIIARTSGSYSNIVGLPVERLKAELKAWLAEAK
jgi:septum formation protein